MKTVVAIATMLLLLFSTDQQPPQIEWMRLLGGSGMDLGDNIKQVPDGGYIMAGYSTSVNGDLEQNYGESDVWVVKLSAKGYIEWQKVFGGTANDFANAVYVCADGGYIIAGATYSNDGHVTMNRGLEDAWILKLDAAGNQEWARVVGGSGFDEIISIKQMPGGGFIAVGETTSADGDVPHNNGLYDLWVLAIAPTGTILWSRTFGGFNSDAAFNIQNTNDGGFIVSGATYSVDGDITLNRGLQDAWILKLTHTGQLEWQKTYGTSGNDCGFSIATLTKGGYIVAGFSGAADGDATRFAGALDLWVVRLDATGSIIWQKSFGGSGYDYGISIKEQNSGNLLVSGFTDSWDGDVTEQHGAGDGWLLELDAAGSLRWQLAIGESGAERAINVQITNDGGYIFCGTSASATGAYAGNHGSDDAWVVKLSQQPPTAVTELAAGEQLLVLPNPVCESFQIRFRLQGVNALKEVQIVSMNGAVLRQFTNIASGNTLQLRNLPPGMYLLRIRTDAKKNYTRKLVVAGS